MFKLESYITPLILSRVEKYVKNVRTEGSQVSLWGGDVSLTNLDLRLDVLEEEFRLPFNLVSGHIHELQIHVPWTRLQSEPIVLTINTIECVLKLPNDGDKDETARSDSDSVTSQDSARKARRSRGPGNVDEAAAAAAVASPPGYVQNLVNKILSNVQIVCNNLIVKYVEDDLVLSINVRHASLVSVDNKWEPAFTELSAPELTLRKLLSVSDLTVCLDRRGPMGKIQVYEDPILYRCYMSVRISWLYRSLLNKTAYRTLFHLHADKLEFSITNKQILLLYRLYQMLLVLSARPNVPTEAQALDGADEDGSGAGQVDQQDDPELQDDGDDYTLGGILWSVGSTVGSALMPVTWDDEDEDYPDEMAAKEDLANQYKLTEDISTSIAFAVKSIVFTLKTSRSVKSKGLYGGLRNIVNPFMIISMQGLALRLSSLGHDWVNVQGGIAQILCTPAELQAEEKRGSASSMNQPQSHSYLLIGCESDNYLKESLFEPATSEGTEEDDDSVNDQNRVETNYTKVKNWDLHMERVTENLLLERHPALAVDYLYQAEYPADTTPEDIIKLNANMEYSNIPERALGRVVVGPANVYLDHSFMDKINILNTALQDIDDTAVNINPQLESHKLEIPTKDDIDNLENNNPTKVFTLTFLHPVIHISPTDSDNVSLECGLSNLVMTQRTPMYPLRNVKVGSMMHPPSPIILNNCHSSVSIVASESWARLRNQKSNECFQIATVEKFKLVNRTLLFQECWKNIYQKQGEFSLDIDQIEAWVSASALKNIRMLYSSFYGRKFDNTDTANFSSEPLNLGDDQGQIIHASIAKLSNNLTWTSKINTVGISIGLTQLRFYAATSVSSPQKPKYFVFFKGHPHLCGKDVVDKRGGEGSDWLHAVLQYPAGEDLQFVPPIVFTRLGRTDVLLFTSIIPILLDLSLGLNVRPEEVNTGLKVDDSGFKSANESFIDQRSDSKHGNTKASTANMSDINPGLYRKSTVKDMYTDLIRSCIVNVKMERTNIYIVESLNFAFASESVAESLNKISSLKPWLGILRVGLPLVQCYNSNVQVGEESLTQYPILFPPTVWIAGKNTLPLALNMDGFEVDILENKPLLMPVSFRCTLSLNRLQKNSNASFVLHTDFSPVEVCLDEELVTRLCGALDTLMSVYTLVSTHGKFPTKTINEELEMVFIKSSSTSQNIVHHSVSSVSEYGGISATVSQDTQDFRSSENTGSNSVSIWLQFTIPNLTYRMIGRSGLPSPKRLSICMEDTSISLDSQATYTKISLRMRKMSSYSEEKISDADNDSGGSGESWTESSNMLNVSCNKELYPDLHAWIPGSSSQERNEDSTMESSGASTPQSLATGFFNLIFTRAEVKNVHRRYKLTSSSSEQMLGSRDQQDPRYLSEIDIDVFPLDVFISTDCIEMICQVLLPFIELLTKSTSKPDDEVQIAKSESFSESLAQLNNNTLPLIYVKAKSSRIFIMNNNKSETNEDAVTDDIPDVFIIELESANVTSQVDNPISRILVDSKLYYRSAESGSLEIPGSSIEDRQYQISLNSFSIYTAVWKEIINVDPKPEKILLRTMSENPALEWNSRSTNSQEAESKSMPRIQPVVSGINSKFNFAPAIVYRKKLEKRIEDRLIAGISLEWNTLTDINMCVSTQQISAVNSLLGVLGNLSAASRKHNDNPIQLDEEEGTLFKCQVPVEVLLTSRSFKLVLYSEKQSKDENTSAQMPLKPFIELCIDQPHLFSTLGPAIQEVSLSLYTLQLALPQQDICARDSIMFASTNNKPFSKILLDCGQGRLDPASGIRPPLLTIKGTSIFSTDPSLTIKFGREVNINLDAQVKEKLEEITSVLQTLRSTEEELVTEIAPQKQKSEAQFNVCKVDICTQPVKLIYSDTDDEVGFRFGSLTLNSSVSKVSGGKLKVSADTTLEDCSSWLQTGNNRYRLISPVCVKANFSFYAGLENFTPSKGFARCNVGRLVLHVGPQHLKILNRIQENLNKIISSNSDDRTNEIHKDDKVDQKKDNDDDGEHFNDDLRLGTFTISEDKDQELPTAYRVVYSSSSITWTYPKPRTLTKLTVLPLPLTPGIVVGVNPGEGEAEPTVECQLQFWSVNRRAWTSYASFRLDESNVVYVDLPLYTDKRRCEFAHTWRIEMVAGSGCILQEVPCSLLSAVRVDSFHSTLHQPQFQFIFDAEQLQICLYNHLCSTAKLPNNSELAGLNIQGNHPLEQNFLTASLDAASSEISIWNNQDSGGQTLKLIAKTRIGINITDYCYLGTHQVVNTGELSARIQNEGNYVDVFLQVSHCDLNVGPFALHTLRQSTKLWNEMLYGQGTSFIPVTQMLLVNETNIHLNLGQAYTDQCIQVAPRTVVMFTWRSQHARSLLRLATSINPQQWSEPFSADASSTVIKLTDGLALVVSVNKNSSTLRTITFKGLVSVVNLLKDHLELKLTNNQGGGSEQICGGQERPVNFVTNNSNIVELKTRLLGHSCDWSNVVNLSDSPQPFLLKLGVKEREFIFVWLHVVFENITSDCSRILAIFAPLYIIQSSLPGTLLASIKTKNKENVLALTGYDKCTQVNLVHEHQAGAATSDDHNFQVSFKLSEDGPSSVPAVPVAWNIVQQIRGEDDRNEIVPTIDDIVGQMKQLVDKKLYSDPYSEFKKYKVMPSVTDCKVNFETVHSVTNTLMVQIQPKLLLVNDLTAPLTIHTGEESLLLEQGSITNANLVSNHIRVGVVLPEENQYFGPKIEILDHDWTYVSLLPSQNDGGQQLSLTGNQVYQISCGGTSPVSCIILITSEQLTTESGSPTSTRVIRFKPYFLLDDLLGCHPLKARTGVVRRKNLVIEYDNSDKDENYQTTRIESGSCMNQMLMWKVMDKGDGRPEYVISFTSDQSASLNESSAANSPAKWSRNLIIRPEKDTSSRQCFIVRGQSELGETVVTPCILLTHTAIQDNQVHIIVTRDDRPQMRLVNRLSTNVRYREPGVSENEYVLEASSYAWHTCSYLQEGFPYAVEKRDKTLLQFTADAKGGWSESTNLGYTQECFLSLPGAGDIKLNVLTGLPTIQIVLEPASTKEISAKDIRERFNSITIDETLTTDKDIKEENLEPTIKKSREQSPAIDTTPSLPQQFVFTISAKVDSVNIGLSDDLVNFNNIQEVMRMTMFNLNLEILPELSQMTTQNPMQRMCSSQFYQAKVSLENMQIDNQMYDIGLYRFPVVLTKHEKTEAKFMELTLKIARFGNGTYVDNIDLGLGKFCVYLEDTLLYVLQDIGKQYINIGSGDDSKVEELSQQIPFDVRVLVDSNRNPFYLEQIRVRDISVQVTVYASVKVHIGLEDTLLNLARYEARQLWCTSFSLGHTISRHYLSGALFKAGWVLGSLDVIGNPAAFTRSVREGIKDFVAMPFEGILRGPWGFLVGLTQGSSSLVKHVSAGTITSVTNFAQSVSRNLDRLSQDPEHCARNEEARKLKPRGISDGVLFGLSSVGVGILGAFGGLAHHPLQVLLTDGVSPAKLVASVGKGLIGMVAKPLGGAAEFIALTGQGLLMGSGWTRERYQVRCAIPNLVVDIKSSVLKYDWNFCGSGNDQVLFACDASLFVEETRQYLPITCLITQSKLMLINEYEDSVYQTHGIGEVMAEACKDDPTLTIVLVLREGEGVDEAARMHQAKDRVAQFVLDTIQYTENQSKQRENLDSSSSDDLVPVHRPSGPAQPKLQIQAEYMLYMNPKYLAWFNLVVRNCKQ